MYVIQVKMMRNAEIGVIFEGGLMKLDTPKLGSPLLILYLLLLFVLVKRFLQYTTAYDSALEIIV